MAATVSFVAFATSASVERFASAELAASRDDGAAWELRDVRFEALDAAGVPQRVHARALKVSRPRLGPLVVNAGGELVLFDVTVPDPAGLGPSRFERLPLAHFFDSGAAR